MNLLQQIKFLEDLREVIESGQWNDIMHASTEVAKVNKIPDRETWHIQDDLMDMLQENRNITREVRIEVINKYIKRITN